MNTQSDEWFAFFVGVTLGAGIVLLFVAASHYTTTDDAPYPTPLADTIVVTLNDVRCYGYVAAPSNFVGIPPRLWICEGNPPWYDSTGKRFPTPR